MLLAVLRRLAARNVKCRQLGAGVMAAQLVYDVYHAIVSMRLAEQGRPACLDNKTPVASYRARARSAWYER